VFQVELVGPETTGAATSGTTLTLAFDLSPARVSIQQAPCRSPEIAFRILSSSAAVKCIPLLLGLAERSELLALTWADIDLTSGELIISKGRGLRSARRSRPTVGAEPR
jgi:hypothetical protein